MNTGEVLDIISYYLIDVISVGGGKGAVLQLRFGA
jgi:hypothetical protein